jgi:hypothetical protein
MRHYPIPISTLLISATIVAGQVGDTSRNNERTAAPQTSVRTDNVPTHTLDFHEYGTVSGVKAPVAIEIPYQSTNDGTLYMKVLDPTTLKATVVVIGRGSASTRSLPETPALRSVTQIDSFPVAGGMAFLVWALPAEAGLTQSTERQVKKPFIIVANENGQVKNTIPLPENYTYSRLGAIPSGDFVLAAYSASLDQTSLNIVDSGGNLIKIVDQPISEDERKNGPTTGNTTHFLGTETELIAWRANTRDDIVVLGQKGATRVIALQFPASDQVIADFEPSDKNWLVHYSAAEPDAIGTQSAAMNYYEVAPMDGSIVRKLFVGGHFIYSIACKFNGTFWGFASDPKGGLMRYAAE